MLVLLACLCVHALPGCDGGAARPAAGAGARSDDGTARMRAEVDRIARDVLSTNRFLGDRERNALVAEFDALPAGVWPERRQELLVQIAVHELRLGRTEAAIARFEAAERLLPELPAGSVRRARVELLYGKGLAWLRRAETLNCVECHTPESCLAPIRGRGVHSDPEPSRRALAAFEELCALPDLDPAVRLRARWLLSVAAMTLGEWPDGVDERWRIPEAAFDSDEDFPRFPDVAAQAGLDVVDLSGGALVEDLDGDGLLDVLTSTWDYTGPLHLMRNRGDGTFEDRTEQAGLSGLYGGLNLVHADYDNDGDADVLVLRGAWFAALGRHPNSLLRNEGDGTFLDVTVAAGLAEPACPTQTAAFADYDGDGDLDVYVGNESTPGARHPCQLFRNEGDGSFTDVAAAAGVENDRYTKGVAWGDYDADGSPDLYVSNYTGENRLYRNRGDGSFEDVAPRLGVTGPLMSFPTWFWDYDNDGVLDLYVAAYVEDVAEDVASLLGLPHEHPSGRLYRGDGQGGFEDVTEAVGLTRLCSTMGANFGDLDNDGWLDLYLGTGYPSYEAIVPNAMFRNREGRGFSDVTTAGGFGNLQKGHAVVFADLEDDGAQSVLQQMGGAYRGDAFSNVCYRNPGFGRHWLRLELESATGNRGANGAEVRATIVEDGRRRTLHRIAGGSGSFGSNPLHVHLGLGTAARVEQLEIRWPGSRTLSVYEDLAADRIVVVREGEPPRERPRRPALLGGGGPAPEAEDEGVAEDGPAGRVR